MEVRVLRYFNEIVREGNISGAAQVLHISQPALSRQMKELENELGVTLFERGHRQIKLTQEGSYLFDRAQEITTLVDRTTDQLQKKAVVSGVINIGAGESRAVQPVMACIKHIMAKFPQIRLNLVSGDSEFLRHQLDTGLIEFAILMGHENLIEYNTMPLSGVNRWGIVVAADSPLAQK
ncbi:LysR family transcriptional regulator [Limosilactobacillus avium]|uniref:LysR family transcriptional regulator n=1 Tax=Limosilactobacillus avium TaxID=2991831 RepID=UPI0024BAAD72|nr:LysR family transcriptional regulator [Limosilactobacillus avium]